MRIIAGKFKGIHLYSPTGQETRPTSDRVRQTLFDMLLHASWGGRGCLESGTILDAFAGTGALGIEAISRGATHAYFFEKNRNTRHILEKNLHHCGLTSHDAALYTDILSPPASSAPCSLIFLDPPYKQNLIPHTLQLLEKKQWLSNNSLIVTETASDESLTLNASYQLLSERKIGHTVLKFWKNNKGMT